MRSGLDHREASLRRLFVNLIVIALVAGVGAFFAAPAVAFFGLRAAAETGDAAELRRLIDYAAVRRALRPQLTGQAETATPAPSFIEDPIGAVRRTVEEATAPKGPDPDAYLSPAALLGLSCGEGRAAAQRSAQEAKRAMERAAAKDCSWPRPRYWGVNRARLSVTDAGGAETVFTFERRGLFAWKLAHLSLPAGPEPSAPR